MEGVINNSGSPLRKLTSNSPTPSPSPSRSHSRSSAEKYKEKEKKLREDEEKLGLLLNRGDPVSQPFSSQVPTSFFPVTVDSGLHVDKSPSKIWRDTSYDFKNDAEKVTANGKNVTGNSIDEDDVSSEFDFQKGKEFEPDLENQILSPVSESPNNYGKLTPRGLAVNNHMNKVSFKESELVQRRASEGVHVTHRVSNEDQVLHCSSNSSFQGKSKSGLMRMKTKSRLMDPPHGEEKRSGRVENRSGMIAKSSDIDEDDPFDDDLPEEYKKGKLSFFTVVQWVSLILIVAALVCSLVIKKWRGITV